MAATIKTDSIAGTIVNNIKIQFKRANSYDFGTNNSRSVSYICMHYTGNSKDKAVNNANYFANNRVKASSHFFVDDTEIWQSVGLKDTAYHVGTSGKYYHTTCRNANAFGIEMCCTAGNYKVSDKTKENAAQLCAYLCNMLNISASNVDTYVLRHYDVTHKSCPAQMAGSSNAEWNAFKSRVKEILKSTSSTTTQESNVSSDYWTSPHKYDSAYNAGKTYTTTTDLNIRKGAGTDQPIIKALPKNTKVTWYGYYNIRNSTTWLWVKTGSITGFVSKKYLK